MEVEDGADVGVAGVVAADARGVGDHDLELGADALVGVGEHDVVLVALGHLAAIEAGKLGAGGEEHLRLGKDLAATEGGELLGLRGGLKELAWEKFVRVEFLGSPASLRAFSRMADISQGAASGEVKKSPG